MRHLHKESHLVERIGWLRAAVLGANDGIISTASLILGVAAAAATKSDILLAGVAGLVAGAMSMAAGEYVSVSSQSDIEQADLARERRELSEDPEFERGTGPDLFGRGVEIGLARQVAQQLMVKDALGAHARDELGISDHISAAGAGCPDVGCNIFGWGGGAARSFARFTLKLGVTGRCRGVIGFLGSTRLSRRQNWWRRDLQASSTRHLLGRPCDGIDCRDWCHCWYRGLTVTKSDVWARKRASANDPIADIMAKDFGRRRGGRCGWDSSRSSRMFAHVLEPKSFCTLAAESALIRMLPSRASSRTRAAMLTTVPLAP